MKKKIFLILILLIFAATCAIFYLNKVILPKKIKSLIINSLQEATQKKVSLNSVQFNIFKGLVLNGLIIHEAERQIISIKEASCTFLILPVFKGKVILNTVKLDSPVVSLKRFPDNTFNLTELFARGKAKEEKQKFEVFVRKLSVVNGRINFLDDTLSPPFTKSLDNLNADVLFSLPANIKFNLKCSIVSSLQSRISASGAFDLTTKRLASKIDVRNLSVPEFAPYYKNMNISIEQGQADCLADIEFKDNSVLINSSVNLKNLLMLKDKILAKANADITSRAKYDLTKEKLFLEGEAQFYKSSISGLDVIGEVNDISGKAHFDSKSLYSDRILANVSGMPFEAKLNIADLSRPLVNVSILNLSLNSLQKLLKDRLQLAIPADIKGNAAIVLTIAKASQEGPIEMSGYIDVAEAAVKLEEVAFPLEGITGRIEFNANQLKLALSSEDISLESNLAIKGRIVEFARFSGRFFDSDFSLRGEIDTTNPQALQAKAQGELNVDLKNIKEPLKRFQGQLEQVKPEGRVHAKFDIYGNINDFKSCVINAQLQSPSVSVYGLKAAALFLVCRLKDGILELPSALLSLYDGTLEANGAMNLNSGNLPYWISLGVKGVKIEELKLDTTARQKDIAGVIQAQAKLNGFSGNLSMLSGQGNINITEGKLWQLDLFKGMGKLIFAEDFANIIFNEGSCGFIVKDNFVFTDNLRLKSNLVEMDGSARIGFDSSVDASVRVHVLDEKAPLTATLKDLATAVIGESGSFGIIKISGTLKNPKFKFQPAIVDIIKGLKDSVLGNIF